jgi:trehalose 6-phosphate phosphatase
MSGLPRPVTAGGRAGLDALLAAPAGALIGSDFDGTLAPIVPDPGAAYAHPESVAALRRLAGSVGTLAIITGRPVAEAVRLGGLDGVPGIIVLGHYGWERWENGQVSAPAPPPGVEVVRRNLPGVLESAGAPEGTWIEDKGYALAVHTRRAADPDGALARLRGPLETLAAGAGLTVEPGRMVIELRPPGMDKGAALTQLVAEREARSVMFCGDDLGDLPAFAAVRALRAAGTPGLSVCSASPESAFPQKEADLVVDGPDGIAALLTALADHVAR